MGSTAQSAQLTPSTFIGGITQGAPLSFTQCTSSGLFFYVGDADRILVIANNGSSDPGALYIEPGARWQGSAGQAPSTAITVYSTATAPVVTAVLGAASSISTDNALSTTGSCVVIGPFDSATVKSSDSEIFIGLGSTLAVIGVAVYAMIGGSTN